MAAGMIARSAVTTECVKESLITPALRLANAAPYCNDLNLNG
jgi:hypothetical protein